MSSTDVVILSGCRTAVGTFGGALKDVTAVELGHGRRARGGAPRRHPARPGRRGDPRLHPAGRARHEPGAAGRDQGRPAGVRARHHREQGLRLGPEGGDAGRAGHPPATPRCRGRRHGEHEPRAVPSPRRALGRAPRPRQGARPHDPRGPDRRLPRHPHGDHRREPGRAVLASAAPSRTRSPRRARPGRRPRSARAASRPRSSPVPIPQKKGDPKPFDTDEHPARGDHRRVARQAEARLQEGWDGDGGERERAQRRRGRPGRGLGRARAAAWASRPRARIVSYASAGGRPEGDGHRPRARGAQGAGEGGHRASTASTSSS